MDTWNAYMNVYKVCQPCRAYNLNVNFYSHGEDEEGSHSGSRDDRHRHRFLDGNDNNNNNDGQGDPEQWGYDCYDNAGYTNCNQVSKPKNDHGRGTFRYETVPNDWYSFGQPNLQSNTSSLFSLPTFSATNLRQRLIWKWQVYKI